MISAAKRGNVLLTAVLAVAASGFGAGRPRPSGAAGAWASASASGTWSPTSSSPAIIVNEVALAQMNHVRGPIHNNVYANNPNSYINHVRDNGFVDRYYPDRRHPSYYGYAPRPRPQRATPTAATAGRDRPLVPLTSFYNDKGQLVWPGDSRRPVTSRKSAKPSRRPAAASWTRSRRMALPRSLR